MSRLKLKRKQDVNVVDREELLKVLSLIKPALSIQDFVPIQLNFCFTGDIVYAFDGIQCAGIDYKVKDVFSVFGDLFFKLLQGYNAKQLSINVSDSIVNVTIGKSKLKLSCLPEKEFTFDFPDLPKHALFKVTEDFITGVSKCLISVSEDQRVENQCGVILDLSDRIQYLYSTNEDCISRYRLKRFTPKERIKILIPKLFCEQLISLFKEYKECEFYLDKDFILARWKNAFLYSKIKTEINFLDFKSVIETSLKGSDYIMQKVPENMVSILERSIMFSGNEMDKIIKFEAEAKKIICLTESNHGNIRDHIEFEDSIGEFIVRLESNELKECVNNISHIGFIITDDSTMIIGEDENYLMLISSFADN